MDARAPRSPPSAVRHRRRARLGATAAAIIAIATLVGASTDVVRRPAQPTIVVTPAVAIATTLALVAGAAIIAVVARRRLRSARVTTDDDVIDGPPLTVEAGPDVTQALSADHDRSPDGAVADEIRDAYVASVSRELRTPLNGVLGIATLMLYDDLTNEQRRRLLKLREAGQHLLAVLDGRRDRAARADRLADPGVAPFRPSAVVSQVVASFAAAAAAKGITLREQVDHGVGLLLGDASQLRRVLQHLVDNAVTFTERGGVDVSVELVDRTGDTCTIRVAVHDTGVGLDAEVQRRLLAPVDPDDAPWAGGSSGLGLAICQQIIGRMGGTLHVVSSHRRGTTISWTVDLPAAGPQLQPEHAVHEPQPHATPPPSGACPAEQSDATVLLVEDDDINQLVARGMLAQLGHDADTAVDGVEAVKMLRRRSYELVLMDCGLPRLDGYETTRYVRAMESGVRHTTIVAMTAAADAADRQRCLAVGMDDHLAKPVTIDALADVLRAAGLAVRRPDAPGLPVD